MDANDPAKRIQGEIEQIGKQVETLRMLRHVYGVGSNQALLAKALRIAAKAAGIKVKKPIPPRSSGRH